MMTVEVTGMEKALADIRGYSEKVARDVGQAINTTAQQIRTDAITLAPINQKKGRGGNLKRLIVANPSRMMIASSTMGTVSVPSTASVESRAKYSEFVEFGTGKYGQNPRGGHTTKERWIYFDELTNSFQWGYPQRPRPFMHPAAEMNRRKHSERIIKALKG